MTGSNGYGKFTIAADGTWTYVMDNAHDEFVGGQDYTDSLTVATADGTTQVLTVTMHGTNDAAITGSSTAELTRNQRCPEHRRRSQCHRRRQPATFMPQNQRDHGSNGYGKFTIAADGTWTYLMDNAHDEFVGGRTIPPIPFTVATADGTTQVLTVTMHGTNDAAVITGSSTAELTETNAAQSTGGDLNATDVDSLATFMPQTNVAGSNGYGKSSPSPRMAPGPTSWTTHTTSLSEARTTPIPSLSPPQNGTTQVLTVTMHGTNDAAVITGSSTAEADRKPTLPRAPAAISTPPMSTAPPPSCHKTNVTGSNGYGKFTIAADGTWTYVMGQRTRRVRRRPGLHRFPHCRHRRRHHPGVDQTMHGTNDAAVITGSSTAELTETNAAQSTGGDSTPPTSTARHLHATNQRDRQQRLRQVHHHRGWHLDLRHGQRPRRVCRRPGLHRFPTVATADGTTPGVDRDHARHQRCRRHHRLQHRRADRNQRCPEHRRRSQRHRRRQPRHLHATNQRDRQQRLRLFTIAADGTWTYVMDNDDGLSEARTTPIPSLSPPQTAPPRC